MVNPLVGVSSDIRSRAVACGALLLTLGFCQISLGQQPNIVLFLVDDMGWNDTSVEFAPQRSVWNDLYNTPSMQRLANQGMKFTNAYAASPVCSPTRVSIMTGMNPGRNGVTDWVRQTGSQSNSNSYVRSPSDWRRQGLQPGDGLTTLPSILKANGYRTAHVGKAHFGARGWSGGDDPTNLGFDINIGGSAIGGPSPSYFSPWIPNPSLYPNLSQYNSGYLTDVLTLEANKIIDNAVSDATPFFINMAHYAVHAPIGGQGDPDFLGDYQAANRPNPEDDYAAMIASMDASLGSVLDNLEAEGVADNTIVMFMSDNGGLSNHTRSTAGVRTVQTLDGADVSVNFQRDKHNVPINSGKGSGYEGGIRVPMIVAWAGQESGQAPIHGSLPIVPGSVSSEPVISDDFFPTILNMASVSNIDQYLEDAQGNRKIDGQDLSPLLSGGSFTRDGAIFIHYPHQWWKDIGAGEGIEPFTAIRDGDYKLIYFYGDGIADGQGRDPRWELYDVASDLGEQDDLFANQPALAAAMRDKLVDWMADVNAPMPISKATGQAVPLPALIYPGVVGDLNGDTLVNVADWQLFNLVLETTVSGDSSFELIAQGDFDVNTIVDFLDFETFKEIFNVNNGQGSFASMIAGVPEPSSLVLLGLAGLLAGFRRRRVSGLPLATTSEPEPIG